MAAENLNQKKKKIAKSIIARKKAKLIKSITIYSGKNSKKFLNSS